MVLALGLSAAANAPIEETRYGIFRMWFWASAISEGGDGEPSRTMHANPQQILVAGSNLAPTT